MFVSGVASVKELFQLRTNISSISVFVKLPNKYMYL